MIELKWSHFLNIKLNEKRCDTGYYRKYLELANIKR